MKSINSNILWIFFFSLIPFVNLISQGNLVLDRSKVKADPSISQDLLSTVSSTLEKAVNDYATYSTLYDQKAKAVNSESVNQFIALFDASTAMMCKDYLFDSIATLYDVNDYFIEVMNGPMGSTGIEVEIKNPVLTEMYIDPNSTDQIISKVALTKIFRNYMENGGSGFYLAPKSKRMILTFKTPTYYQEEGLITLVEYYSPGGLPSQPLAIVPTTTAVITSNQPNCTLIDANSILPPGVNEDTLTLIESLICDALDDYKTYATLLDTVAGAVTGTSGSLFQQLFSSGASLHISDFREYPDNIEVATYREDVFKFFRTTGISFKLTNPRIKSISYDPDGFYFVKVSVTKEVPVYLDDENYEIKESGKKRSFPLDIDYVIAERTMSNPLIEKAISTAIVKPEEKRSIITFGPNFTSGLVSGTSRSGYENITDKTTLGSVPGLGFQVDFLSNFIAKHRAPKKPLFLAAGLSYQSFNLEAKSIDLQDEDSLETIDCIQGIFSKEIVVLKDQVPMKVIGLSLGVEYRLIGAENKKLELFLGGKIVPTYFLGGESSFNAEGFYNLRYEQYGFAFYDDSRDFNLIDGEQDHIDGLYDIGEFSIEDNKGPDIDSKFLMGYRLEASMLFELSATFMLNARIGYGGYFGEIIAPSESPSDFPFQEKPKPNQINERNTLFQEYYSEIAVSYLSFSVGLAYLLN